MQRRWVWLFVAILFFSSVAAAEIYRGTLHGPHTKCSDGQWLPEAGIARAELAKSQFAGPADHYARLVLPSSGSITEAGFAFYRFSFRTDRMPVLLGTELSAKRGKDASHFAVYPPGEIEADKELTRLNGKVGAQADLLKRLVELDWAVIAAHPSKKSESFDWTVLGGIDAIEMMNDGSLVADWQTVNKWLELQKKGVRLGVTAGNDSHTALDPKDPERWRRQTAFSGTLSRDGIFRAIKERRTWAERDGVKLVYLNHYPSKIAQTVRGAVAIQFMTEDKRKASPAMRIYRDGILLDRFSGGRRDAERFDFSWVDLDRRRGEHSYVIVEDDLKLITSPIVLQVE